MAQTHVVGCILGTAVGDALGLPYEGLSRRRAAKLFGPPDRHRFFFGHGMVSDDTEHACMVVQSLIVAGGDVDSFRRELARRFRFWLLGFPGGIGVATLRSILRLWIGFRPEKSGVFSAGNGPAMRAAVIGAAVDNPTLLRELARASSRITHTDPKAEFGAFVVALATQMARQKGTVSGHDFLDQLNSLLAPEADELVSLIRDAVNSIGDGQSTMAFAKSLGLSKGVSGYTYHSVPIAIHAWLSNQGDFRSAVSNAIACGGDTDSTGAMVGGIVGASVGKEGIPMEWLNRLFEWPRSINWMERLGAQLDGNVQSGTVDRPIKLPIYGVLPRNLFFLLLVVCHGFRRLLPPY
ncbi:MAG: ADP-ribosylglycohydrolase family protein [bacterium]